MVAEHFFRLGNVGKSDRHIAGLERLPINDGLLAQRGFDERNQLIQPDDLRFAKVEYFKAKLISTK